MYPLYTTGFLSSQENLLYGFLIGILFGFILERGGFGRSSHIAPIFYFRDLTVSKTMVSAILTTSTWIIIAVYNGWLDFNNIFIPTTYLWAYVAGGALFGLGMVMSGWCPGTAVVGGATGRVDAFVFILGLLVGMRLYFDNFDEIATFVNSANLGKFTFDKLLDSNLYTAYFVTVVLCIGLAIFMNIMKKIRDSREGV